MALIQLTLDDILDAKGDFSGMEQVHIEERTNCDGELCGERPELDLSPEDYERYLGPDFKRPPIGRHSHLVISRTGPDSRRYYFKV